MPWLLAADEAVYRWLQFHRTCATAAQADLAQDAVVALLALMIVVAFVTRGRHHFREVVTVVVVVATGAALGELLKTMVERVRPRSLPMTAGANSFPSGHVMNTALIATAAYVLVRRAAVPRWMRVAAVVVAVTSVSAQAGARVFRGSHWVSDVPGSVLLAVAWTLGAVAFPRLSPARRAAAIGAAVTLFVVAYYLPAVRIALPSPLDDVTLRAGSKEMPTAADVAPERRFTVDGATGASVLKMALQAQCATDPRDCCLSVDAAVNGWSAPPLTITSTWHEFHLAPPPGVLRPGANTVVVKLGAVRDGREGHAGVGVAYARTAR